MHIRLSDYEFSCCSYKWSDQTLPGRIEGCRPSIGIDHAYTLKLHTHGTNSLLDRHQSGTDRVLTLQPGRHGQVLGTQKGGVEQLGLVARAVVTQDRHDRATRPQGTRELDCARDVDPRRAANTQTFVLQKVKR